MSVNEHLSAMFPRAAHGDELDLVSAMRTCLARASATLELLASMELGPSDDAVDAALGYVHMAQSLYERAVLNEAGPDRQPIHI